jgi:hypothetical protein
MVSLAFPVIILVIESHFKIISHIFEKRLEQAKWEFEEEVEERRKIKEDRKEKRLQAIKLTSETFRQVNNLVSEVRVYDENEQLRINEIIGRIASQSIVLSELINTWIVRFPILPSNVHSLFRGFIIVLYWGAWGVAHCMHNKIGGDKKELQESLAMIQRGIIGLAFQPIFSTLTISMNLMQSIEELYKNIPDDGKDKRISDIKSKVRDSESRHDKIIEMIRTSIENSLNDCLSPQGSLCDLKVSEENILSASDESVPNRPISAVWLDCKEIVEGQIIPKIIDMCFQNIRLNETARNKMENEIKDLISNIFQLKVYYTILRLDEFENEEILPSAQGKYEAREAEEIRQAYQAIKTYMKNRQVLKVGSDEYKKFFSSPEYLDFKKYYFGIKDTDLINMVAVDTVYRIKSMGVLIRFGSVLRFGGQGISAVQ